MSEVFAPAPPFFDRYLGARAEESEIGRAVGEWHASDDAEIRSLAAFLGMSEDEYAVYVMDRTILPALRERRLRGGSLWDAVAGFVERREASLDPGAAVCVRALRAWLADV